MTKPDYDDNMEEENNEERTVSEGKAQLQKWLNKNMKIKMTDGRMLVGVFVCTDKDKNVILGSCQEYVNVPDDHVEENKISTETADSNGSEPRLLGLAMIPGRHIVKIEVDDNTAPIATAEA